MSADVPIVLLPVGADDQALDACLAALDAGLPAGARVWLADDAQAGPRGQELIRRWLRRTALCADYSRRSRTVGEVVHLQQMLDACGDADVIVLAADVVPVPGWAAGLAACFARDPAIASATPWCNAGQIVAWPQVGRVNPMPDDVARLGRACAMMPPLHPELPAAVGHAVALRGRARRHAGGLDTASFASGTAALIDLSLRLAGLGWRNVLCETAFVMRAGEGGWSVADDDTLAARWPGWHARLADFLAHDPLHAARLRLRDRLTELAAAEAPPELLG